MSDVVTPWGPVGEITFARTYARQKDGRLETFPETIDRCLQACRDQLKVDFTVEEEQRLRTHLLSLKGSLAGRFMWQLGTTTVDNLGLFSLQNCAATVIDDPIKPFLWTFDALMLGSGVGYNLQKEHVYQLPKPKSCTIARVDAPDADFIVPDSREGWVALLERVLVAHFKTGKGFTYSTICVRGKGTPIKGFGGTASGPEELCWGMTEISKILNRRAKKKLNPIDCLDIMNIIGAIVVAGNVRRSAQVAIGDMEDMQFLNAKRWDLGGIPNWRAMSNNTVVCNDINLLPEQFWQGYQGNGEPYGLFNLMLARKVGRTGETQYPDKKVMISNPCVTGDTELLTPDGYKRIDECLDTPVTIWNGFEWSEVQPKITGRDQRLVKVTLSDGRTLTCTEYHEFKIAAGYTGAYRTVKAANLKINEKLVKHTLPVLREGVSDPNAYTQGFISGDGMDGYKHLFLYEPKYVCEARLNGTSYKTEYPTHTGGKRKQFNFKFVPKLKTYVPFELDLESRLEWFAGLLDADGTELKEGGTQIVSVDHAFLRNVQKLLTTMGVQSKVTPATAAGLRLMPDGKGGSKDYYCQAGLRLLVGAVQMQELKQRGLRCCRLPLNKKPQRDASQFVRVTALEYAGVADTVYCFNEPKRHLGLFNGILTGQCMEQSLEPYETCCLAELFLPNITGYKELLDVATLLYRVNKHSLALPCHQKDTEKVVHRNMRMGIGVTGYLQATDEQRDWLSAAYTALRQYDEQYSAANNFPRSIKLTTVKPSGTLSLLAGVTPGCHPGYSQYFIRRIRMASSLALVNKCRDAGYPVEYQRNFDGSVDRNTVVVEFPCAYPPWYNLGRGHDRH